MGEFDFLYELKKYESDKFKKCIRILLDRTFLYEGKYRDYYLFAVKDSMLGHIRAYLSVIGFDVYHNEKYHFLQLIQAGEVKTGWIMDNCCSMNPNEVMMLLEFAQYFYEMNEALPIVTLKIDEYIDRLRRHKVVINLKTKAFKDALAKFKRFSLISYTINNDEFNEDTVIIVYPTVLFTFDFEALDELLKSTLSKNEDEIPFTEAENNLSIDYEDDFNEETIELYEGEDEA